MENYIELVKFPRPMTVTGFEALSIGENFSLFFKEFSAAIDKKMGCLTKSVHIVDYSPVQKRIGSGLLYVKNTGVEILTPEGFSAGMGNMMAHTQQVVAGIYLISSLKTEASRLYDWLKQIIRNGRIEDTFRWTIGDFGSQVEKAENFIRNLPDHGRSVRFNLGQVYLSFDEMFDVMNTFNNSVRTMGPRDIELVNKELTRVYELGTLLVKKIQTNDITLGEQGIADVESIVNKFIDLTNVCGAMAVMLNELTAVFNAQIKTISEIK
jgi:hypothetical protein